MFYNILKFNFITSLIIFLKSRSNTVAYLFFAGNDPLFAVAQDRASVLRLYYSSSVGVRILPPNTIFMKNIFLYFLFLFLANLFNVLAGTFTSEIT